MRLFFLAAAALSVTGCASIGGLRTDLSAKPIPSTQTEIALQNDLMGAFDKASDGTLTLKKNPAQADVRDYILSGFALTDLYCDTFFRRTNQSLRKRKFGRTATNDVGTVVASVLGLSNVGPKVISGVATGFGLADSTWRNYDDAFVVAPELDVVRSLVLSAQDEFRRETLDNLPNDYASGRSVIVRYAGLCSFLGMQALLNQSVDQQRRQLQDAAKKKSQAITPDAVAGTIPK